MKIAEFAFYIAKSAIMCYNFFMNNYFEYKLTYNQISLCYTNKAEIDEREIHAYNEILFFLGEEVSFLTESFRKQIEKHTLIVIPKEKYHYFDTKKGCTFERLKIKFPHLPEFEGMLANFDEIRIISVINESMFFALKKICSALESNENAIEKFAVFGAFLLLLSEISKTNTENAVVKNTDLIFSKCIEFINSNLKNNINIEYISKKLNISESTLTHTFKKEMGISVHKYIQQKRLVFAKTLIQSGNKPTKIYLDCGYNDYSAFYKAYYKMFGHPPSDKQDNFMK